jgi:diguanylate cyclase (GGDEF)-like protein
VALVRLLTAARRERAGRGHLALAAELGIAPVRLAGLNAQELTVLQDKVAFDELTGVMRRAGGLATLDREIARARRQGMALSVAFVDVDGLKKVNDTLGHAAGDRLLRNVVEVLSGRLRADDAIFRYGGDEFCCVLPNANLEAAVRIVEDALLAALARGATFSFGVAQLQNGEDRTRLLARADTELYKGRAQRGYPERS